jgi:ribosomal protein L37AE/L43A
MPRCESCGERVREAVFTSRGLLECSTCIEKWAGRDEE